MDIRSRGFTLIELLVVIAIIGILSAVVLASLNVARSKGSDAAIQANLSTIRFQSEIYLDDNNGYGTNTALESGCSTTDNMFGYLNIKRAAAAADSANAGGSVVCNVSAGGTAYAVFAQMVTDPNIYWCIDSLSVGKIENALTANPPLTMTETACP